MYTVSNQEYFEVYPIYANTFNPFILPKVCADDSVQKNYENSKAPNYPAQRTKHCRNS